MPASINEALDNSVLWLLQKLEENPEGLLEFHNADPKGGISAHAWKDSAFSYVHADGSRANHHNGIASLEVQALAYDALCDAALYYSAASKPEIAGLALEKAENLRKQVFTHFWIEMSMVSFGRFKCALQIWDTCLTQSCLTIPIMNQFVKSEMQ